MATTYKKTVKSTKTSAPKAVKSVTEVKASDFTPKTTNKASVKAKNAGPQIGFTKKSYKKPPATVTKPSSNKKYLTK